MIFFYHMKNLNMKSIFCSIFMSILFFTATAQVSNDQFSIITKVSADWCPNCGGWAWDVFEDMRTDLADKNVIYVLAHRSGDLETPTSRAWCENLKYQYQPEFYLNNDYQNMNSSTAPDAITSMGEQIDLLSSFGAFAGVYGEGIISDVDTEEITAHVDLEFYGEITGEYYIGVYFIQNNIIANQSQQGDVLQPKLLTDAFTEDWYGIPVTATTGVQSFDFTTMRPAGFSAEEGDTEILTVVWNKIDEETYVIFNAHVNGTIQQVSNTTELTTIQQSLKGNIITNTATLSFDSAQNIDNATFFINDISGRSVYTQSVSNLQEGNNSLEADVSNLTNGIYVMGLNVEGTLTTVKVFKK